MRFSGSKAISDGFAILKARFGPMLAIGVLFYVLPGLVLMSLMAPYLSQVAAVMPVPGSGSPPDVGAIFALLGRLIGPLIAFGIIFTAIRLLGTCALTAAAGGRESEGTGEAIGAGVRSLLPMIGVYLLLTLAYLAVLAALFLTVGMSIYTAVKSGQAPGIGSLGMLILLFPLLVVGALYLGAKLSMILPVVVLDKVGNPIEAIARSWRLTRGATLKIILVFILVFVVIMVVNGVLSGVMGRSMAMQMMDPATAMSGAGFWISTLLSALLGGLFSLYMMALLVGIHGQLAGPPASTIGDTFS